MDVGADAIHMDNQWTTNDPAGSPTPSPAPAGAPAGAHAMGTPTVTEDQKGLAAVAYILTWLTGLIIFFVAKKEQRYARWHAVQSIGIGIIGFAISIIVQVVTSTMPLGMGSLALIGILGLLSTLIWIGMIVLIIIGAMKAYKGESFRLPVLADFADKYA